MTEVTESLVALQKLSAKIRSSRQRCKVCQLAPEAKSVVEHEILYSNLNMDKLETKLHQKGIMVSYWSLTTHRRHLAQVQAVEKYEQETAAKSIRSQERTGEKSSTLQDAGSVVFTPPTHEITPNRILNDIHRLDQIIERLDDPKVLKQVRVGDVLTAIRLKADLFGDIGRNEMSVEAEITVGKILAQVKKEEKTMLTSAKVIDLTEME